MAAVTVSGCIVTYNNMRTIEKTVSTLLEFTRGVDFTLYIQDNDSTDGTPDFLLEKFKDEPRVIVTKRGINNGFGAGHNSVLSKIDSDYHVIINPDIEIRSDVIVSMAKYMEQNKDIGLLSPRICFPDGRDQILGKRDPKISYLVASRMRNEASPGKLLREYAMLDCDLSKPCDIQNATGCFMMLRTSVFKEIGGFDSHYFMYFEDCDLTRTVRKKYRAVYYPDAIIYHVWGRESKKNLRLMAVQIKSMMYYFKKWWKNA